MYVFCLCQFEIYLESLIRYFKEDGKYLLVTFDKDLLSSNIKVTIDRNNTLKSVACTNVHICSLLQRVIWTFLKKTNNVKNSYEDIFCYVTKQNNNNIENEITILQPANYFFHQQKATLSLPDKQISRKLSIDFRNRIKRKYGQTKKIVYRRCVFHKPDHKASLQLRLDYYFRYNCFSTSCGAKGFITDVNAHKFLDG